MNTIQKWGAKILGLSLSDKVASKGYIAGGHPPTQAIGNYSPDIVNLTPPFLRTANENYLTRAFARNLKRTDPIVQNWLQISKDEVVGNKPVHIKFHNDMDLVPDKLERELNEAWIYWQTTQDLSNALLERDGFKLNEMLKSTLESMLVEGDSFIVDENTGFRIYTGGAVPEQSLFIRGKGQKNISGILFDEQNRKIGYEFKDYLDQPLVGRQFDNSRFIPASKVIHVFDDNDRNHVRGTSALYPIIPLVHFMWQWDNACLVSLIKKANYPIVFQRTGASAAEAQGDVTHDVMSDEELNAKIEEAKATLPQEFGKALDVPPDVDIKTDPFTKIDSPEQKAERFLQMVATGLKRSSFRAFQPIRPRQLHLDTLWRPCRHGDGHLLPRHTQEKSYIANMAGQVLIHTTRY